MKTISLLSVVLVLGDSLSAADAKNPKDALSSATRQLAEKPNYSWTSTTKEAEGRESRIGPIDGKADKEGLTYLSFNVAGGIPVEVYIQGSKGTAKALEGWQTFDEIAQTSGAAMAIVRFLRSYQAPAAESANLAEKAKELKEADGTISGELPDDIVKEILARGARRREGQDPPKITDSKGSIKFWLKEGS